MATKNIVIQLPNEDTPGILTFLRRISLFNQVLTNPAAFSIEDIDEAYEFLVDLVVEPKTRPAARKAVMKLSMKQLNDLFTGLNLEPDPKV